MLYTNGYSFIIKRVYIILVLTIQRHKTHYVSDNACIAWTGLLDSTHTPTILV